MTKQESAESRASGRRVAARHLFETRICIFANRDDGQLAMQGWSRDLSESGLGAFVGQNLVPGESVTVQIPLSDGDKTMIPATVAVKTGTRYGFQFTALSAEQRHLIRAALASQPVIPFPKATEE